MSLGSKLQNVASRVNIKLGTQDATIVFRKITIDEGADFGQAYDSATNSNVTITSGIQVSRIRAHEVDGAGTIRVGDLKLLVPGGLVTEAQLTGAVIVYGSDNYGIVAFQPVSILSGVVVQWQVIGRIQV